MFINIQNQIRVDTHAATNDAGFVYNIIYTIDNYITFSLIITYY